MRKVAGVGKCIFFTGHATRNMGIYTTKRVMVVGLGFTYLVSVSFWEAHFSDGHTACFEGGRICLELDGRVLEGYLLHQRIIHVHI